MRQLQIIIIFMLSSCLTFAQTDAQAVFNQLIQKMNQTGKYQADISIEMDVKFINIKKRTGKIFFSPPDSVRFKIDGFAFLPKKGFNSQMSGLTNQQVTALGMGQESLNGVVCEVIKVIPSDINSEIVVGQMWVDVKKNRLIKMTTITKNQGSSTIDFDYEIQNKYDLPSKMVVSFEIKNQKLPASFTGDFDNIEEEIKPGVDKGSVLISYSNFVF
jgi:outer membrane lipoprotein-sorting protein